jgi:peptide/nickel transport system permease protein
VFSQTAAGTLASPLRIVLTFFKRKPLGAIGSVLILILLLTGIFGPLVAPYEPDDIGIAKKYATPSWHGTLLGADQFGRDVFSRILYGARISLLVGVVASTAGTLVGAILGLISGYWGGRTDALLQRFVDVLMSFPLIILALTLLTALQRSLATVIIAIGVPFIPYGARVIRASAMVIKEIQFVEAARAIGCSDWRIIARHIAPSCVSLYLVLMTGFIGVAIITESALGFLGLSIPPPTPTLGGMLSEALALLMFAPHVAVAPGVFITLAVFAFNVLGDSLRDVLDPRLRGRG